eukprot:scaffold77164_cov30-Tisochrysis_lutea.AAC.1
MALGVGAAGHLARTAHQDDSRALEHSGCSLVWTPNYRKNATLLSSPLPAHSAAPADQVMADAALSNRLPARATPDQAAREPPLIFSPHTR